MSQSLDLETWKKPKPIDSRLIPIRAFGKSQFRSILQNRDSKIWFMTEIQRATMEIRILEDWDRYREILGYDGTFRHFRQLRDMAKLGGGVIVTDSEYGMGKSILSNTHLKIWQLIKGVKLPPYVYFRKAIARERIKDAPANTGHSIDEGGQRSSGSGSISLEKHLGNQGQTIRKTGKLICIPGLDVGTGYLGKSIAFKILPFGINFRFQANRFIVLNYLDQPIYLAVLQRNYYPWEHVFYQDGLGTWAEYESRARRYSRESDGVIAGRNPIAEAQYVEDLKIHWKEKYGRMKPLIDVLKFEARQIGVPPENSEMIQEIASTVKAQLRYTDPEPSKETAIIKNAESWDMFRILLIELASRDGWEYAKAFGWYTVPEDLEISYPDIVDQLGLTVLPGSLGKQIRQGRRRLRRDSPKEIGDIGEKCVTSWLDSCGAIWGGGGEGVNDVSATIEGVPVALNVKTTLADSFKEHLEVTPECFADHGFGILVIPRKLEIRIYVLDQGDSMTINSGSGRLATPETIEHTIKELIQ